MKAHLIILEGKQKGYEIPLPETIFLIGRDEQCHLRPHCETVSQLHCAIAAWGGKVRVRDLRSRNGTLINGHPIRGEVAADDGDELQIGSLRFVLSVKSGKGKAGVKPGGPDMQWLLESSEDSPVLAPGFGTWLASPHAESAEDAGIRYSGSKKARPASASLPPKSKSVSAGPPLRDQIEKGKRRAGGADASR